MQFKNQMIKKNNLINLLKYYKNGKAFNNIELNLAIFNTGDVKNKVSYPLNKLGFNKNVRVKEAWNNMIGEIVDSDKYLSVEINPHGVTSFIRKLNS